MNLKQYAKYQTLIFWKPMFMGLKETNTHLMDFYLLSFCKDRMKSVIPNVWPFLLRTNRVSVVKSSCEGFLSCKPLSEFCLKKYKKYCIANFLNLASSGIERFSKT